VLTVKRLIVAGLVVWTCISVSLAAYPQTKPRVGTLCAAKYKGRVATSDRGVKVKCVPVVRYQWKVVPR
jgi:hypothetical protein